MEDIVRISQILQGLAVEANRLDLIDQLKNLEVQQRKGISVAVIGNFGGGKSTLINALLGYELLPTSTSPTQSGYIRITFTEQTIATVQQIDSQQYTIAPVMPEIASALTEKLRLLDIQVQTQDFPPEMCLYEVSDIGGINPAQIDALNQVLAQTNTVIFTTNGRAALNETEITTLKKLPSTIQTLFIAVTHLDEVNKSEQDLLFENIINKISSLNLELSPQFFRTSGYLINNKRYDLNLLNAWDEFKQAVINLPEALYTTQKAKRDQVTLLKQVADDLHQIFSIDSAKFNLEQSDTQELRKNVVLLNRVIDDQTKDIEQTLRDNFNAFAFRLHNNLQGHLVGPEQIEIEINSWLESETTNLKARYERLYRSVLSDASSLIGRSLDFHPEILHANPVRYVPEDSSTIQSAGNQPRLANLSDGQKLTLVSGGIAVVAGLFVSGPVGWALLVGGSVLTGITVYFLFQREGDEGATLGKVDIPQSLIQNVSHNSNRLREYLKEAVFQENDGRKMSSKPHNKLVQIRDELNRM